MVQLLQQMRAKTAPCAMPLFSEVDQLICSPSIEGTNEKTEITDHFPHVRGKPRLVIEKGIRETASQPKRVGVVLSGGQAAGGHNVIIGLFETLKKLHPQSILYGFLEGPLGIIKGDFIELTQEKLAPYLNQGGFDMIGSGRTKIETSQQLEAAAETIKRLKLDALLIIGGDDSNTNALILAEYFAKNSIPCQVNGVPKTIDGDLKVDSIEISFGFDTATKNYSATIGDIARDCLSAKKAYYFIKLMGRSASHITLECALQTHPNLAFISEEIGKNQLSLSEIIKMIADLVEERAQSGKHYGIILIPEGVIEFIPDCKELISELNALLGRDPAFQKELDGLEFPQDRVRATMSHLSNTSRSCFEQIPQRIQLQLLMDRDPHGNVQVSKIETERLFIDMTKEELKRRSEKKKNKIPFSPQPLFVGYEGRSCLPSPFDANYCYNLGAVSACLIDSGATGYIAYIEHLEKPIEEWKCGGIPLTSLIHFETRKGRNCPVIKKALVELDRGPFQFFAANRDAWRIDDDYQYPGAMQFFGPSELTDRITQTLELEKRVLNLLIERN